MKAALVVHRVTGDVAANVARMLSAADKAARHGVRLILFAEMASTGFINSGDPRRDREIAETVPGPVTGRLGVAARERGVWIGVGIFERDGLALYDSAILIDPSGTVQLIYRRAQPNWRTKDADPDVYRLGDGVRAAETPFGRVAFLLCGDLFDDAVVDQLKAAGPDLLLFPFARCFDDGSYDQGRWDSDELPHYLPRVRRAGVTTLMANYVAAPEFDGGSFGGAMHVAPEGALLSALPLGRDGILFVDL